MSSLSSKYHTSGSKKRHSSSSKPKTKMDDWTEVADPEERRRIQNRLAQRKFREKVRQQKNLAQRDMQNQQFAGSNYHIPKPDDIAVEEEPSGLPWGSINMRHVVAKGHENASQQGSQRPSNYRAQDKRLLREARVAHDFRSALLDPRPQLPRVFQIRYGPDFCLDSFLTVP